MSAILLLQVVSAFVLGGLFTTFLTLVTERSPRQIAGIFMALPTTVVFTFFFLGWVAGKNVFDTIAPTTVLSLSSSMLFLGSYISLSRIYKRLQLPLAIEMALTYISAICIWFALGLLIALLKFHNLPVAIGIYTLTNLAIYQLLTAIAHKSPDHHIIRYTTKQKIMRMLFVGTVLGTMVAVTKLISPFWGGVLSMFPAVFSVSLLLFHYYHGTDGLAALVQKAPIGNWAVLVYVLCAVIFFPKTGIIWGTLICLIISFCTAALLLKVSHLLSQSSLKQPVR